MVASPFAGSKSESIEALCLAASGAVRRWRCAAVLTSQLRSDTSQLRSDTFAVRLHRCAAGEKTCAEWGVDCVDPWEHSATYTETPHAEKPPDNKEPCCKERPQPSSAFSHVVPGSKVR